MSNAATKLTLTVGVYGEKNRGGRKYLEDYMAMKPPEGNSGFLAVFDGHCGREAAEYARDNLWEAIKNSEGFDNDDPMKVAQAIKAGFLKTHEAMWEVRSSWKRSKSGGPSNSGTTVACVIFQPDRMFVASVGDSAVVLGRPNPEFGKPGEPEVIAEMMTRKHTPANKKERERIKTLGGSVSSSNRVVWEPKQSNEESVKGNPKLNMTRSLGDLWSITEDKKYLISPIPDVCVCNYDYRNNQFVILGTDGLWNVITPQESVETLYSFCNGYPINGVILDQAPKMMINKALERWSERKAVADNITVMIVSFQPHIFEVANDRKSYHCDVEVSMPCSSGDQFDERLLQSSYENSSCDLTKLEFRKRAKELETSCLSDSKKALCNA